MSKRDIASGVPPYIKVEEDNDVVMVMLDAGININKLSPRGGSNVATAVFEHKGRLYLVENHVGHADERENGYIAISAEGEHRAALAEFVRFYTCVVGAICGIHHYEEFKRGEAANKN